MSLAVHRYSIYGTERRDATATALHPRSTNSDGTNGGSSGFIRRISYRPNYCLSWSRIIRTKQPNKTTEQPPNRSLDRNLYRRTTLFFHSTCPPCPFHLDISTDATLVNNKTIYVCMYVQHTSTLSEIVLPYSDLRGEPSNGIVVF